MTPFVRCFEKSFLPVIFHHILSCPAKQHLSLSLCVLNLFHLSIGSQLRSRLFLKIVWIRIWRCCGKSHQMERLGGGGVEFFLLVYQVKLKPWSNGIRIPTQLAGHLFKKKTIYWSTAWQKVNFNSSSSFSIQDRDFALSWQAHLHVVWMLWFLSKT